MRVGVDVGAGAGAGAEGGSGASSGNGTTGAPGVGGGDRKATLRRAAESGVCSLCWLGRDEAVLCVWGGSCGDGGRTCCTTGAAGCGGGAWGWGVRGGVGVKFKGGSGNGADACFNHESSARVVFGGGSGSDFSRSRSPRSLSPRSLRINAFIVAGAVVDSRNSTGTRSSPGA